MKVLVLTNLYPNPIQPHRAPWNRAQLRGLSARHDVHIVSPILWTDEMSARRQKASSVPTDRRSTCDGIPVEHPRYLYPPQMLRGTYGNCFLWSVGPAFRRLVRQIQPDIIYSSWAYPDGWAAVQLASRAELARRGEGPRLRYHCAHGVSRADYVELLKPCGAPTRWSRSAEAWRPTW